MDKKIINSKELTNQAYALHCANKLDEAEKIYSILLENNSSDPNVLNLYGLLCLSKGNHKKAIELLSKALIFNKDAYIMTNLAKAYYMSSDIEKSLIFYKQAVELAPSEDIYYSMGIAYKQLNHLDKAIEAYKKALTINPNNYNALYNLAVVYSDNNDIKNAISIASKAEFINPNDVDIHTLLSTFYESQNEYKKAIIHLEKAAQITNNYIYFYNLGVLYSKIENINKSIENYKKVLVLNPTNIETLVNLSTLYKNDDKNESIKYLKMAYSIAPNERNVCLALAQAYRDFYDNKKSIEILKRFINEADIADAHTLLAINYMDLQKYDDALASYNKALAQESHNLDILHGKAMALKYLGKFDEAKLLLEYILSKDSKSQQSVTTLGMMLLQQKDFNRGMELYIQRSNETKFLKLFNKKIWTKGFDFTDKIVLIYSDCGLGDTIMFSRYIPFVQKIAKKVVLQTDKELVSILKDSFEGLDVYSKSEKVEEFDIAVPIMNLAYALDIDFNNIPLSHGYLKSDAKPLSSEKIKVGIFYQGNKRVFKNRSIPFAQINQLSQLDNVQIFSFQLENFENETSNIINLSNSITDYKDTASILKSIDVLVTIDSSIVHMAGALGVKTYLLLPHTAEWRWFNDEATTPWYNSIEIFKQKTPTSWVDVIERVKDRLNKYEC